MRNIELNQDFSYSDLKTIENTDEDISNDKKVGIGDNCSLCKLEKSRK